VIQPNVALRLLMRLCVVLFYRARRMRTLSYRFTTGPGAFIYDRIAYLYAFRRLLLYVQKRYNHRVYGDGVDDAPYKTAEITRYFCFLGAWWE
jgi:hypothetical protein